jgi:hypothetical protein
MGGFLKSQGTDDYVLTNVSFKRPENTHSFSPLNILQTAENQGFFESRQTVSIFP